MYSRMHVRLNNVKECEEFVSILNSDKSTTKWVLENEDAHYRANARSLMGTLYFSADHNDDMYLVNESTGNADFPGALDKFRI